MRGSGGLYNPYFTATYEGLWRWRDNWMDVSGKERPQVPAPGDVPFLPAVWDSHLESDDPILPSFVHLMTRVSAHLSAQDCMDVRRNAPLTVD